MTHLDKIAEAIREASYDYWYEKQTLGFDTRSEEESRYVAEKLMSALGLTEEWTWSWSERLTGTGRPGYGYSVPTRQEAQAEADPYMTIVSRLVGPWGEGGEG